MPALHLLHLLRLEWTVSAVPGPFPAICALSSLWQPPAGPPASPGRHLVSPLHPGDTGPRPTAGPHQGWTHVSGCCQGLSAEPPQGSPPSPQGHRGRAPSFHASGAAERSSTRCSLVVLKPSVCPPVSTPRPRLCCDSVRADIGCSCVTWGLWLLHVKIRLRRGVGGRGRMRQASALG